MAIQSIQRALDIICLFSKSRPTCRLTDIANRLGLKISTVHGIVSTLEQNGFLQYDSHLRQYSIGSKIFELGAHFSTNLQVNLHARDYVQTLAERTGCSNRIGIWDKNSVLITLFAFPEGVTTSVHNIGPRITPYCTAIGRAMLAFMEEDDCMAYLEQEKIVRHTKYTLTTIDAILDDLEEIRKRGYAINRGELTWGRAGLAAPIWGPGEKIEASLAVIGATERILGENINNLATELVETVSMISDSLGYNPGQ
ncbi:MAG: IclR family transcriptional regulator [Desulfobacteraceae bacterium]|nr:IclR family transcriptional regulator [Desulfobacteraceae bacterium]